MKFFEAIRNTASDAAFEAQKLVRVQKQQAVVSGLQKERDTAVMSVGNAVVQKGQEGSLTDPDLVALTNQVSAVDARLKEAQAELERIRAEQAPDTGPSQAAPQSGPTAAAAGGHSSSSAGSTACPQCGSTVSSGSAFCTNCGARVEQPHSQAPTMDSGVMPQATGSGIPEMDMPASTATSPGLDPVPDLGEPVSAGQPQGTAETARRCASCGAELSPGSRFCTSCGAAQSA